MAHNGPLGQTRTRWTGARSTSRAAPAASGASTASTRTGRSTNREAHRPKEGRRRRRSPMGIRESGEPAYPQSSKEVDAAYDRLVDALRANLGERLLCVLLCGSWARGEAHPPES